MQARNAVIEPNSESSRWEGHKAEHEYVSGSSRLRDDTMISNFQGFMAKADMLGNKNKANGSE
jgi:hypothetical protein